MAMIRKQLRDAEAREAATPDPMDTDATAKSGPKERGKAAIVSAENSRLRRELDNIRVEVEVEAAERRLAQEEAGKLEAEALVRRDIASSSSHNPNPALPHNASQGRYRKCQAAEAIVT